MAAFTYQHPPFHLDSLYLSNDAINKMSDHHQEEEDIINNPIIYFPNFSPSDDDHHSLLLPPQEIPLVDHVQNYESIGPCMSDKTKSTSDSSYSSTVVDFEGGIGDQVINQEKTSSTPLMEKNKKRKNRDGSSLNSSAVDQSKDGRRGKAKKQKKNEVSSSEVTEEIKCKDDDNKKKMKNEPKKIKEDPPTGYVHVRARRGQATDSHSLAERVRREKISERLKMLQGLVPGCDKVNSKALMLDEIINYVQSLQLQVEMLSMKLASMNPIFYDFGADLDAYLFKPEKPSDLPLPSVPMTSVQQSMPTPSTVFGDLTTTLSTNNNIPLLDSSVPFSLQQEQQQRLLNDFSQKNEEQLWNVGYQRQRFINQLGATNLCFFQ